MSPGRFFRRAWWDRERRDEIASHIDIETDDNVARGMSYDDARAAAQRKFGNGPMIREEIYRMNTVAFLDRLVRGLRYELRILRRNPLFAAVTILTVAIGIGANTAVFSVVNSVLLKPLAYPAPERLVSLRQNAPGSEGVTNLDGGLRLSASMYFTYSEQNRSFQALGAWSPGTASVTETGPPEEVRTVLVSNGILQALAVRPALGRWLNEADQQPDSAETVVLGYGYWQGRFGGQNSVIGKRIRVDGRSREIVGVMPPGFRIVNADADLILPVRFDRRKAILAGFGYQGVARLRPGVTIAEASADISHMAPLWMNSWSNGPGTDPRFYETWRIAPALRPLKDDVTGNVRGALWVVMATIAIVMLIACANVANLLLARTESRQQELALRAALGAGWGRIVQELLFESMLLGLTGGAIGVGLAWSGLRLLKAVGPGNLPRLGEISLDARVLAFTVVLSLLSGLLFGLIPAFKYAGVRMVSGLRIAGPERGLWFGARDVLVVAQVALALVLLVSAGLMIRTFQTLRNVDPGFTDAVHLQTMRISIPRSMVAEPERVTRMQNAIADKLAAIPGVTSAAFIDSMPMEGLEPVWDAIEAEGKPAPPGKSGPMRLYKNVSPGYFRTAGTQMVAGRELTWTDVYNLRLSAMVSENLARELWGTPAAAIGKRFREFDRWWQVIGVVQDVRENGVHENAPTLVYWPSMMNDLRGPGDVDAIRAVTFAIRSDRAGTEAFLNQVRQAVWSVSSSLPVASVRTMRDIYGESLARTSFTLTMLGIAGLMALVLGIIGIYGVVSYGVSQRRREIGIRLALGAWHGEVSGMFLRHGMVLTGIGVLAGLAAAAGLMRLMKSLLFGVSPMDPVIYLTVPVVLFVAAGLASYLPARRAGSVDPAEALRAE